LEVLFERDRGRCHLCGRKVLVRGLKRDPLGPSIDHLVPIALGGEHSYANTALAHMRCNMAKHIRPMGEQLRLG